MKVYEVLDDVETIKTDLKSNKGKAISAIVRGAKRKSNGVPQANNDVDPENFAVS